MPEPKELLAHEAQVSLNENECETLANEAVRACRQIVGSATDE